MDINTTFHLKDSLQRSLTPSPLLVSAMIQIPPLSPPPSPTQKSTPMTSNTTQITFHNLYTTPTSPSPSRRRNPARGRTAAEKAIAAGEIPRPPNAFILYRQDKQPELLEQLQATCSKSLNSKDMSILIGRMWKEESAEEKQRYKNMSSQIKREHQEKYPNFKYSHWKAEAAAAKARGDEEVEVEKKLTWSIHPCVGPSTWPCKRKTKSISSSRSTSPWAPSKDEGINGNKTFSASDSIAALIANPKLATRLASELSLNADQRQSTNTFEFQIESQPAEPFPAMAVASHTFHSFDAFQSFNEPTSSTQSFLDGLDISLSSSCSLPTFSTPTSSQIDMMDMISTTTNSSDLDLIFSTPSSPFDFSLPSSDFTLPTPEDPFLSSISFPNTSLEALPIQDPNQKYHANLPTLNTSIPESIPTFISLLSQRMSSPTDSIKPTSTSPPMLRRTSLSSTFLCPPIETVSFQ